MYSVLDYGHMARDGVRMDAYARAIERVVRPGAVVLDLGAGTGVLSLLAARAGAARVHAVETNPAIWLLQALASENGLADRIRIHAVSSFDVELDEQVDVIVGDLRGSLPLFDDNLEAVRDACARWLKPDGVLLPARDRLFVAVVEADGMARELARAAEGFDRCGLTANALHVSLHNDVYTDRVAPIQATDVITTSEVWGTIEYRDRVGSVVEGTVDLLATRSGTAHGLALWFEATILDELGFSNAPGHTMRYARLFLPFLERISLAPGDRARVTVRADERGELWGWDVDVRGADDAPKASFRQSTFLGSPISAEMLLRSASSHRPTRSARGDLLQRILARMDGDATIGEIVDALGQAPPNEAHVAEPRARVLREVRAAVQRYGR
jgi:SAM-dependent methyltransferase